ncbi:hypothetical protein F7O92_32290, partial [Pseudomonas aeruginosa]
AGIAGPFTLRVLDSHSVFAGIACLAAEGTRLLAQGSHPNALRDLPGFAALENACRERDIHLHLGMLSPTGGINLGAGAMSL